MPQTWQQKEVTVCQDIIQQAQMKLIAAIKVEMISKGV